MKKFLLSTLFALAMFTAQAQEIPVAQVPVAAVDKFKAEHADLPAYIKPTWYKVVQTGGTKTYYKVSYMNGTRFETYGYNLNGLALYSRFDWYNANNVSADAMKAVNAVKAAYPTRKITTVSEFRSARYNINGVTVMTDDYKLRKYDLAGVANNVDPSSAIDTAVFADLTNFQAAAAPIPNNIPPSETPKGTKSALKATDSK
jgi:hypothetical protein